jgi:glutaredoxin
MKNIALAVLVLVVMVNWRHIDRFFDGEPAATGNQGEVVLYATSWCGYCSKTRELFEEQGVAYTEFDIERSEEGMRRFEALDGNGVPLVDVRGTIIQGYDRKEILTALGR